MIIASQMQNIIQIYPCLLKLSRKQESVTDGQTDRRTAAITISPHRYRRGIIIYTFFHIPLKYKFNLFYTLKKNIQ
jgi:hypothetical protein